MPVLRGRLLGAALIVGVAAVFFLEALAVVFVGAVFGWSGDLIVSVLAALGVMTAFVCIRLKRRHTVEVYSVSPTQITLKELRSFTHLRWAGVAITVIGVFLAVGNMTDAFPTFPFLGAVVITIGVALYVVEKSKAS